jgi:hypothetical protein
LVRVMVMGSMKFRVKIRIRVMARTEVKVMATA